MAIIKNLKERRLSHPITLGNDAPPQPPPPPYTLGSAEADCGTEAGDGGVVQQQDPAHARKKDGPGMKAAKAFGLGLGALVASPFVLTGALVYGTGKILEGVGKGLTAGPKAAANELKAAFGNDNEPRAGGNAEGAARESRERD
ncbi:hypothetical protein BN946_scf184801.g27 [Trametes cinnabarina]|uniref:Uncharacterized protein n=1 Tax=Pycnoporus cinnabarinus TaxID=5643 RepID=A0A060SF32_PYCCI|nr:hypothetical protein BN946_scf184801.g27 [Trametes cinnabarina]